MVAGQMAYIIYATSKHVILHIGMLFFALLVIIIRAKSSATLHCNIELIKDTTW